MKNFLLLSFFLFLSASSFSQVVTGVYRGQMQSDSLKTPVDFELTLKEKNGKLYGYCHRLFIVNDVLFYNLVKVNGRIKDSVLIIEDEKSVSNNFEENTKGIKTVFFFNLKKINDTAVVLAGDWNTSTWRNNRAISGQLVVNREKNYLATQLYKRLEEKKLDQEMAFNEPVKQQPVVAINKTNTQPKETNKQPDVASNEPKQTIPSAPVVQQPTIEVKDSSAVAINKANNQNKPVNQQPAVATNQPKQNIPSAPVVQQPTTEVKDSSNVAINKANNQNKPVNQQPAVAVNQPKQNIPSAPVVKKPTIEVKDSSAVAINKTNNQNKPATNQPVAVNQQQKTNQPVTTSQQQVQQNKPPTQQPSVAVNQPKQNQSPVTQKPVQQQPTTSAQQPTIVVKTEQPAVTEKINPLINKTAADATGNSSDKPTVQNPLPVINNPVITKRQMEIIQTVDIAQDSIVLSLYDNGEIDGDTVSVFVNNELLISKVGLSAKAYKKTLYFKPGESLQLTLFAENLGSIPPNTGLLVIYTDTDRYQINFTSTFSKSSSVLLRRKQ